MGVKIRYTVHLGVQYMLCINVEIYSDALPKTIKQRCFKVRWGGGEGNLPTVWKFSLSLKTPTLEEIEGEELMYI
jgi:hypothetical protein